MEKLTLGVKGATCDHCVRAITGAVSSVPGVAEVTMDLAAAEVSVDGDEVDAAAVRQAISEAGYEPVG